MSTTGLYDVYNDQSSGRKAFKTVEKWNVKIIRMSERKRNLNWKRKNGKTILFFENNDTWRKSIINCFFVMPCYYSVALCVEWDKTKTNNRR